MEEIKILEEMIKARKDHMKNYEKSGCYTNIYFTLKAEVQAIENLIKGYKELEEENEELKQRLEDKDKIINEMEKYIDEITEKIAREKGGEDFEFCDNKCADKDEYIECKQCIKEYFENKVKESK